MLIFILRYNLFVHAQIKIVFENHERCLEKTIQTKIIMKDSALLFFKYFVLQIVKQCY